MASEWRPSVKLRDLLSGRATWDDADPAIRSMARLQIFGAATMICAAKTRPERVQMLAKIPQTIRPQVEAEVKRLWASK